MHNADCCGVGRTTPEGSNGAKTASSPEGAATELSQQSGKVDSGKGVNSANATVISAEVEEKYSLDSGRSTAMAMQQTV